MPTQSSRTLWRTRFAAFDPGRRAAIVALLSVLPLAAWWLGWFPGFVSSDSVDQLGQVRSGEFSNQHPAFHTMIMWLVMRVWDHPGAVTLAQVIAMTALLAVTAKRLATLGVPVWLAGGTAVGVASLPAVGVTTIALWKDVPFTLALLWAFSELLGLAADPAGWDRRPRLVRLGTALALVWLLRHNGFITVVLIGAILAVRLRRSPAAALWIAVPVIGGVAVVTLVLYPLAGVDRTAIQPATVFIADVAASFVHNPDEFSDDEVDHLASIAPLDVWRDRYDCHDSTPLIFDPRFDAGVIERDPARFRSLVVATYLRDPLTVAGHRWCVSSFLLVPPQPEGAYFHRPPFEVYPNDLGIARAPLSQRARALTLAVFTWAERDDRLWLTWRPALAVWAALLTTAALAWRRQLGDGLWLAPALVAAHMANIVLTTPAQEFRFAFGIYLMSLLMVPLLWKPRVPHGDFDEIDVGAS